MKNRNAFIILMFFAWVFQLKADDLKLKDYVKKEAEKAAKENKMLVIEFWAPSCNPCMALKRDIFENKLQVELIHKYFSVLPFSPADSIYKPLFSFYNLEFQSSIIYVDKQGNEIDRTIGYNGDRDIYMGLMQEILKGRNVYTDVLREYNKDSLNLQNCFIMAKKLASRYEYDEASRLFNKILLADPADRQGMRIESLYNVAEIEFIKTGSLKKMREFIELVTKNYFAPKAYVYLINDLINKKNKSECISICESGLKNYPNSWEILNKYAWAICSFKIKDQYPKALSLVQKSISINPSRPGTHSTESWIYFEMGDKQKAIESVKRAIDLFPDRGFLQDLKTFEAK